MAFGTMDNSEAEIGSQPDNPTAIPDFSAPFINKLQSQMTEIKRSIATA